MVNVGFVKSSKANDDDAGNGGCNGEDDDNNNSKVARPNHCIAETMKSVGKMYEDGFWCFRKKRSEISKEQGQLSSSEGS